MSNSTYVTVKGKAYWAKVFPENKDATGWDNELTATGGQYVINLDLDTDSVLELTKLGSQTVDYPKEMQDEEGKDITTYKFKRLHEKYDKRGNLLEWASGAPKVKKADGTPWDIEEDSWIGNGSTVELRVCVYKAGKVVGTRLEEVKVIDHVPAPVKETDWAGLPTPREVA